MSFLWLLPIFVIPTVIGLVIRSRRSGNRVFSASEIMSGRSEFFRGRFLESELVLCLGRRVRKIPHEGELGVLALHSNADDFMRALQVQFGFLCDAPELYRKLPARIKVASALGELKGIPNVIAITADKKAVLTTPKRVKRISYEKLSEEEFIEYVTRRVAAQTKQASVPKVTATCFPIGFHQSGKIFSIDLLADHHAMILGASGSGKTVLLHSVLSAITEEVDPEQLRFLVLDFKGGTGLQGFSSAVHCDHIATDLEIADAERVLQVLESEIRTREREIIESGSLDAISAGLPRLLVVIDELPALLKQLPYAAENLNDIAQRGRGLGVHLFLAAQTLKGVPQSLLANIGCRILLLHRDNHERETFAGKEGLINVEVGQFLSDGEIYSVIVHGATPSISDNSSPRIFRSSWLPSLPIQYLAESPEIIGIADDLEARTQRELRADDFGNFVTVSAPPKSGSSNLLNCLAAIWGTLRLQDPEEVWDAVDTAFQGDCDVPIIIDDFDAVMERLPTEWGFELQQRLRAIASEGNQKLCLAAKNEAVLRGFLPWASAHVELQGMNPGRGRLNEEAAVQFALVQEREGQLSPSTATVNALQTYPIYTSRQQQAVKRFGNSRVKHISAWQLASTPQIFWKVDLLDFRMFMQRRELPPPTIGYYSALVFSEGEFQRVCL